MRAVNLIPPEQRSGSAVGAGRSQGGAYAVLFLLAGLAVLAVLYGLAHRQIASRRAQAASVTAQAQQAQSAADRLAPYTSFIALREQRTQAVSELVNSRFDWAHVFHEFGRVLPVQVSVSSLTGAIASSSSTAGTTASSSSTSSSAASGAAVTSATPAGSVPTFTLSGCATSQRAVALMLERLRLMDGVSNVTLQSSTAASSSGGGGGSGGGCQANQPAFTAEVSFDPTPAAPVITAATASVSRSTGSVPAPSTSPGAGAK